MFVRFNRYLGENLNTPALSITFNDFCFLLVCAFLSLLIQMLNTWTLIWIVIQWEVNCEKCLLMILIIDEDLMVMVVGWWWRCLRSVNCNTSLVSIATLWYFWRKCPLHCPGPEQIYQERSLTSDIVRPVALQATK